MVRDGMYSKDVASKVVINDLKELLYDLGDSLDKSHILVFEEINKRGYDNNIEDLLNSMLAIIADIKRRKSIIDNYMDEININYKMIDDINTYNINKIGKLENEIEYSRKSNGIIMDEVKRLKKEHKEYIALQDETIMLKSKIIKLENDIKVLENKRVDYIPPQAEFGEYKELKELMDLIKNNVKSLAVSEYMRSDEYKEKAMLRGEDSHRFKHSINNEELRTMYVNSGNKLTNDIVEYFNSRVKGGVTYQGLCNRLKEMGAWVGRVK